MARSGLTSPVMMQQWYMIKSNQGLSAWACEKAKNIFSEYKNKRSETRGSN